MGKVYVDDVGTEIVLDCGEDIASATGLAIKAKRPDGSEVSWVAELAAGSTTEIMYVTQNGDLNQAGDWKLQAAPTLPNWNGRGETAVLPVHGHFE